MEFLLGLVIGLLFGAIAHAQIMALPKWIWSKIK